MSPSWISQEKPCFRQLIQVLCRELISLWITYITLCLWCPEHFLNIWEVYMLTHTPYVSDTEVSKLKKSIFLSFAPTLAFLDLYPFLCLEVALYNTVFKWSVDMWAPERTDMAVHLAETTQVLRSLLPQAQSSGVLPSCSSTSSLFF